MPTIKIDGIQMHYVQEGSGSDVILLHGWGQNTEMMQPVMDHLKHTHRVVSLDFPGFGQSEDPGRAYSVADYAALLRQLIEELEINNPVLIGHSFGCRVAIHYASTYPVAKMILTGAAGLRSKRTLRYYARVYTFKSLKWCCRLLGMKQLEEKLRKYFGSSDYKNTSGVMRETFVKVVNDDVKPLLGGLSMPVLLVFGDRDDQTPLWMGETMEKLIPNAGLAVFEGSGHYAYLEQLQRFLKVCDVFL